MTTGQRIRDARKKAGLTQKQLGEQIGVSGAMIGQYETGIRNPKPDTLKKIADPLGVHVYELYGDEEAQLYSCGIAEGMRMASARPVVLAEEEVLKPYREKGYQFTDTEALFIIELNRLNVFGQLVVLNKMRELAKQDKFREEVDDNAPQDNP